MKKLITIAAAICGLASIAATSVRLGNGANIVNTSGEILGVQCMTVDAAQAVTASVQVAVSEYTNAYKTITLPHTRYEFSITNYDGQASVATNVLDNFSYNDWIRNGTNYIISAVKPVATNISEQVADGKRLKATYTKELAIGNGTASSHYLEIKPASTMYYYGGEVRVSCGAGDAVLILIK